jgi:predicted nucleic acid-binding protein
VIDQIHRGNDKVAAALKQLLASGADVRCPYWTYYELAIKPGWPRTRTAQRLMIEELRIPVEPPVPFPQRAEIGIENQLERYKLILSTDDLQLVTAAKVGGGEVWSFDKKAFLTGLWPFAGEKG